MKTPENYDQFKLLVITSTRISPADQDWILAFIDAQQAVIDAAFNVAHGSVNIKHNADGTHEYTMHDQMDKLHAALDHMGRGTAPVADGQGE